MKIFRKGKNWILLVAALALVFSGMFLERAFFSADSATKENPAVIIGTANASIVEDGSLPDIIENAVPAVVNISSKRTIKTNLSPFMRDQFFRQFFERYFRDVPREQVQRNLGSGVIVDSEGYILTSNHLVGNAEEIKVTLPDNREFDAEVVGTDSESDVAVIRIEGKDLPSMKMGDSERLRLGETVIAIGYPFGVGQTVTKGIVSALGRSLRLVNYEDFIQTDAAINPGNSGGALINMNGELIGINTAIVSRSGGSQGIGFAIPIKLATSIMESIIKNGYVVRGYLGVYPQDITHKMAKIFDLKDTRGALVAEVAEGTPAEKAGLKRGDVIVAFNGRDVEDSNHLHRIVAETIPDTKVDVDIVREGKSKSLEVKVGRRPESGQAESDDDAEDYPVFLGVGLENINDYYRDRLNLPDDIKGVVVTNVDENSAAGEAGLRTGDVIVEINRRGVEDLDDLRGTLADIEGDTVVVVIYREGHYSYLDIEK